MLVANLQVQCAEAQAKLQQHEAQRKAWEEAKVKHDTTKARLAHVEEQLAKYEQQQKRRVLQDTTNTTGAAGGAAGLGKAVDSGMEKGSAKNAIRALSGSRMHA